MSLIPPYKIADCSSCPSMQVPCRKRGKNLLCLNCCKRDDNTKQIARSKVRSLGTYQREEDIMDSVKELTIDIDMVTSRYIRIRDMESDGKITCYCCDKRVKWEQAHAAHYINRQHMGTRFLFQNIKSNCFTCNVEKRGNLVVYAERLNKEDPGIVDWLIEQSHIVTSPTRNELKQILFDRQQKLRMVELKLKK